MRFRPFDLFPYPFGANASFLVLIISKIFKKSNNENNKNYLLKLIDKKGAKSAFDG